MAFRPVVDGGVLPVHPASAIANGSSAGVDLLVGTNRDEFKIFTYTAANRDEPAMGEAERLVAGYLVDAGLLDPTSDAAGLLTGYGDAMAASGRETRPRDLIDSIGTDAVFRVPALRLAEGHSAHSRSYVYRFDWVSTFAGGALGACHGLELPFVFGTLKNPVIGLFAGTTPAAYVLSEAMQRCWVAFARTGDPSSGIAAPWPRYRVHERATMCFGPSIDLINDPDGVERELMSSYLGRYGRDDVLDRRIVSDVDPVATSDNNSGT
jgi:para-nitrobenzyl esterase